MSQSHATAARLGASPLRIDWSGIAQVSAKVLPISTPVLSVPEAWQKLKTRFESGEIGFFDTPVKDELSQATASIELAREVLNSHLFTDILFLGIGGSVLGPISLLSALEHRRKNALRFHFAENPDPIDWKLTLSRLKPESTLVCAVTKSGGTFETIAQLLIALEWLKKEHWKTHLIAITDPTRGDLRRFAQDHEIRTLSIAPSLGGRFSVFSPVGLFACELAGLQVSEFLKGAHQVREHLEKTPLEKGPIGQLALQLIRNAASRPVHVCMPYSTRLRVVGDWFVQLWGESLGKDGKGFTPVAAVGATDQHSILQLLRDGPDDKVTWFVSVNEVPDSVSIPRAPLSPTRGTYDSFNLLQGHTLQELLIAEYQATSLVLSKAGRAQVSFQLDELNERGIGALLFSLCALTALTGTLWGINPFDQPGVEEGKIYTRNALLHSKTERNGADSRTNQEGQALDDDSNSPVHRLRLTTRNESQ
ncbi:MAG: glucose-6-phosphate isomerase [Oligoflexia bacterium]